MPRSVLVLLAALLLATPLAAAKVPAGATAVASLNCALKPTPDGCLATPVADGSASPTFTDAASTQWRFGISGGGIDSGRTVYANTGAGFFAVERASFLAINSGH